MSNEPVTLRVFIIDDHDDVRHALAARLNAVPGVKVVGEVSLVDGSLRLVQELRPDVVVVETKRQDGRGLEVVNCLARSGTGARVVVLTTYLSEWEEWAASRAGAVRCLLKDIGTAELVKQIRAVMAV